jgi:hypothetical protein
MILPQNVVNIKTPTGALSNIQERLTPGSYDDSNEDRHSAFTKGSNIGEENKNRNFKYREEAFYSTPKFVHSLTTLCDGVLEEPAESQKDFLL